MNYKIATANACYTGGGIYLLYGEFANCLFFMTSNDAESIAIYDADPYAADEADFLTWEWHEAHVVAEFGDDNETAQNVVNGALRWIGENRPDGNYIYSELANSFSEW